ncbi:MAG: lactonase family protein [Verrucomicrobiae bacterium]|nr:lactonase family protein [Verrucomicrobiae bacterium]
MKRHLTHLSLFALLSPAAMADSTNVWFGTTGPGIHVARLNTETGKLSQPSQASDVKSPGFLALHPTLPVLYAVCDTDEGPGVAAFAIDGTNLTPMGEQSIGDGGGTHVAVHPSGNFLTTAQYGGGSVAVFPLAKDGSVLERSQLIEHEGGSRAVEGRQDSPHPHWSGFDAAGAFAFVPDLGLDGVVIYKVVDNARLKRHGFAATAPGSGPRHMKFSPDGKHAYVLNEMALTVTTFDYDPATGTLKQKSTAPALTDEQKARETFNSASEIRVHPSGKLVYTANRGHDTISVVQASAEGSLTLIENEPIRGGWPRNFNLDPSGKWLLAAGRDSNTVAVFAVDQETGELTYSRQIINVPSSICVLFSR